MNDILAAYKQARFEKTAQEPESVLRGQEMTPAMRAVRNAIEESIRREHGSRQRALEAAQWARGELLTPQTSMMPAVGGAGLAAGAGAGIESALQRYSPRTSKIESAVQKVMEAKGEKFGPWAKQVLGGAGKVALPGGAPELAQALQSESRLAGGLPGHGTDKAVIDQLRRTRVRSKTIPGVPRATPAKAKYHASKLWTALGKKMGGTTGRQRLRKAIMGHEAVAKGQGRWGSSPTLRGAVKGLGTAASLYYILPWLRDKLRGVPSEVSKSQSYATKQLQIADALRQWRQSQLGALGGAKSTADVSALPFAPYAKQLS